MREDKKGFILQNNLKIIAFDSNSEFSCVHVNMSSMLKFIINSEMCEPYNENVEDIELFSFPIVNLQPNL